MLHCLLSYWGLPNLIATTAVDYESIISDGRMRADSEKYADLFDTFLPCVVGRKKWRKSVTTTLVSNFVTVSDEALCLVILENNRNSWINAVEGDEGHVGRLTKFTMDGCGQNARKHKGWSRDGWNRYNELYQLVKRDRESEAGKDMEKRYLETKADEAASKSSAGKRKKVVEDKAGGASDNDNEIMMDISPPPRKKTAGARSIQQDDESDQEEDEASQKCVV